MFNCHVNDINIVNKMSTSKKKGKKRKKNEKRKERKSLYFTLVGTVCQRNETRTSPGQYDLPLNQIHYIIIPVIEKVRTELVELSASLAVTICTSVPFGTSSETVTLYSLGTNSGALSLVSSILMKM